MPKKLTVTVTDIPSDLWKSYWVIAMKRAEQDIGMSLKETDQVEINADLLLKYPEEYSAYFASALALHAISTADKFFNE